jgi:hypothetical protein
MLKVGHYNFVTCASDGNLKSYPLIHWDFKWLRCLVLLREFGYEFNLKSIWVIKVQLEQIFDSEKLVERFTNLFSSYFVDWDGPLRIFKLISSTSHVYKDLSYESVWGVLPTNSAFTGFTSFLVFLFVDSLKISREKCHRQCVFKVV